MQVICGNWANGIPTAPFVARVSGGIRDNAHVLI